MHQPVLEEEDLADAGPHPFAAGLGLFEAADQTDRELVGVADAVPAVVAFDDVVVIVTKDNVSAATAENRVVAVVAADKVIAVVTVDRIGAIVIGCATRIQGIGRFAEAVDYIVFGSTINDVVVVTAKDQVKSGFAEDSIIVLTTIDLIIATLAVYDIRTRTTKHHVSGFQAANHDVVVIV